MFTGFIQETGLIEQVTPLDSGAELIIQISSQFADDIPLQSHLAIDGRVFTVLGKEQHPAFTCLKFYASHLDKVKTYTPHRQVNLERALRFGDELPGTFFYGLPSGVVQVTSVEMLSNGKSIMTVSFEDNLINFLSVQDQVCLDGVLLQIKELNTPLLGFELYPHTLSVTNLGARQVGNLLWIEIEPLIVKISRILPRFIP